MKTDDAAQGLRTFDIFCRKTAQQAHGCIFCGSSLGSSGTENHGKLQFKLYKSIDFKRYLIWSRLVDKKTKIQTAKASGGLVGQK